jgi:hypothetical protein
MLSINMGKAIVIPILKDGKDHSLPSSSSSVCLTSCVCKLFEKQSKASERTSAQSFVIGQHHSSGGTGKNPFLTKHVVGVFHNTESAYDSLALQDCRTLADWNLNGQLPTCLHKFVSNRRYQVQLGAILWPPCKQENGIPQGSDFSVTLCLPLQVVYSRIGYVVHVDFAMCYRFKSLPATKVQPRLIINQFHYGVRVIVTIFGAKTTSISADPGVYFLTSTFS